MPSKRTIEQPHYFPGQLLTATGLNRNLANEWERRWTHNRALHGTGVVTGLAVTYTAGGTVVTVEPGHAIDPHGRELILTEPRAIQIPPLPGASQGDGSITPDRAVLIIRWDETPAAVIAAGSCGTQGASAFVETPTVEFTTEDGFHDHADAVPLATVDIAGCVIHDVDFGRRSVLGERRLPYVDAGASAPADWYIFAVGHATRPIGVSCTVDTSIAGFNGAPFYQSRLGGSRVGQAATAHGDVEFVMWTAEGNLSSTAASEFTIDIAIPLVHTRPLTAVEGGGHWSTQSFDGFLGMVSGGRGEVLRIIADDLRWAITWIGVEGSL